MQFDFETRVNREGLGTIKEAFTPEHIAKKGLVCYRGAEFDFPTCPAYSRGVMECAQRGLYAFTPQNDAYNERIIWWQKQMRGWDVDASWIQPTQGTIFALCTAIRLFVKPGGNIVVAPPCYNRYAQAAHRMNLGAVDSPLLYQNGVYSLDFDDLDRKLAQPENQLLVICNPNNPTGTRFERDDLQRVAAIARKHGKPVFCDEIFAEVTLDGQPVLPYLEAAQPDDLAIVCTSLGKCMSLTGVNHANVMIKNPDLFEKYNTQRYADHYGSIDPVLYAGLMAAHSPQGAEYVRALCGVIAQNARKCVDFLQETLPGVAVTMPQGTFVLWVDYSALGMSDEELSRFLIDEALFVGDEGTEYGATDQFVRYNLAVPPKQLDRSLEYVRRAASARGYCDKN